MQVRSVVFLSVLMVLAGSLPATADGPDREQVEAALDQALRFFHDHCSHHGGYVWRYSRDLTLSEGEAETGPDTAWVQPPGTPAVGMTFLEAWRVTGKEEYRDWAVEVAHALVRGQMQSGGWFYRIDFDEDERKRWGYRDNTAFRPSRRKNRTNVTTLDDDVTPAAIRLLMQVDRELDFSDRKIHDAATFALDAILAAQYPNGGWYQNWDRYPKPASADEFPVLQASYPDDWSRIWLNDWPGRYFNNDNVSGNVIATLLEAWDTYEDERYLEAARRGGEFLIRAQMPAPQPAWAQQYDPKMHPCWDRKFEPPAISGLESQDVMETLLLLYRRTGEKRFLEPIPRALKYLKDSEVSDGRLARFYELKSNRPLYFTKDYKLTYDPDDSPTHYGFVVDSRLDAIAAEYARLSRGTRGADVTVSKSRDDVGREAAIAIGLLDRRGAWVDRRSMKGHRKASPEGVIQSETFNRNARILCEYLRATN
ncbi:MAG: pectate lyase [Maioricimonas sp. JB045]